MEKNMVDKRIINYIKEHHILTLATSNNNKSYCCTCFYVYLEDVNMFVITSDRNTKHVNDIMKQNYVSGAIALETKIVGKIRGIQFTGTIEELTGNELIPSIRDAKKKYFKKFPFAILKQTLLWGIKPDFIKMTDNRLGFGKKLIWHQNY